MALVLLTLLVGWYYPGGIVALTNALASRALAVKDLAAAERWLVWSRRFGGNEPHAELLAARLARRQNRFDDVRRHLLHAQKLGASIDLLQREQWLVQAQAGQMREAEPHLAGLLVDPRSDGAEICEAYVTGYLLTYQLARARAVLKAWEGDFPGDPQPHLIRARMLQKEQNWNEAVAAYRRVIELAPGNAEAMRGLADVLATRREPAEALEWYRRVPNDSIHAVEAQIGAANCQVSLGETAAARKLLTQVLAADPEQPLVLRTLARLELEAGNYPRAVELLRKAQEQRPQDDETLYLLAAALRRTGGGVQARQLSAEADRIRDTNIAINKLAGIVAQKPEDVEARYQIGTRLLDIGMRTEALIWLNSVLQFEPDHAGAREAIERARSQSQDSGPASAARL